MSDSRPPLRLEVQHLGSGQELYTLHLGYDEQFMDKTFSFVTSWLADHLDFMVTLGFEFDVDLREPIAALRECLEVVEGIDADGVVPRCEQLVLTVVP